MNILCFADTRFPIERANGVQTMATCHALASRGHTVTLVTRADVADKRYLFWAVGSYVIAYRVEPKELVVQYNEGTNGWSAPKRWPIDDGLLDSNALVEGDLNGDHRTDLLLLAENHIYFLSDEGETTVIETGPIFKVIARNVLGEKCQASIAISHGSVFIRSVTSLFCIH
jgi:hypothetical protein